MLRRGMPVVVLVALAACRPSPPSPPRPVPEHHRVAVLEFRPDDHSEPAAEVAIPRELGAGIARALARRLANSGVAVVNPDGVFGATPMVEGEEYGARLAGRVGRRVGASRAIYGVVTRYQERKGTAWSAETPASVAYQAALVRTADGAIVKVDRFDFTQHALSENLLELPRFLRGGGRWLTCQEILDGALAETASRFAAAMDEQPPAPGRNRTRAR